ncbi:alpha/beta hydrolase family protein [Litoreibacter roseus]|uniref:Serine aminopeptidase S33 domain-containing protein n=1 Tax=Litoreibacter roseus TaxID=2601869 RepID=A0A6N6JEH6_9RHOB|nr:alpha/beta hydrolase [Litoreibacter roseus]GFE64524.1 hypothetical protein KIN_15980 [Litoreibacter roseus]
MMRRIFRMLGAVALVFVFVVGATLIISGVGDFDVPSAPKRDISFKNGDTDLHGTFVAGSESGPIVLIVHGDGAQDRWSDGYALPLVNALVEAGLSVFSWDKPGTGTSTGNWLHQTMQDRAAEVSAALAAIRNLPGAQDRSVGLLGFSQAGWVLRRVPSMTDGADFMILIGAAINWQDQERYFTSVRLSLEGKPAESIAAELDRQAVDNQHWFGGGGSYQDFVRAERAAGRRAADIPSKDRFHFIRQNRAEDARADIDLLTLPLLVLMGAEDLNVDPQETVSVYRDLIGGDHPRNAIQLIPQATHSLLDAQHYNYQLPDQWSLMAQIRFALAGRKAYQDGVIQTIAEWINTATSKTP